MLVWFGKDLGLSVRMKSIYDPCVRLFNSLIKFLRLKVLQRVFKSSSIGLWQSIFISPNTIMLSTFKSALLRVFSNSSKQFFYRNWQTRPQYFLSTFRITETRSAGEEFVATGNTPLYGLNSLTTIECWKWKNGSFTLLVFSIYGGMGRECQTFYHRLAEMIAEKQNEKLPIVISWLRTKICFSLLKSCLLCIRGSRRSSRQHQSDACGRLDPDITIDHAMSRMS